MYKYLYIMGTSHSGSTLSSFLLNAHPHIVCPGEASPSLKRLHDRHLLSCSCGKAIGECEFWNELFKRTQADGFDFRASNWLMTHSNQRLIRNLFFRNRPNALLEIIRKTAKLFFLPYIKKRNKAIVNIIKNTLEISGKKVFADASKGANRLELLKDDPNLDVHLLWLVRDVRAVSSSLRRKDYNNRDAAVRWTKTGKAMKKLYDTFPENKRMFLKYEDLCADPQKAINRIHAFVGVEPTPLPADFKSSTHHIIGNNMRNREVSTIKLDEKWRKNLSEQEKAEALEIAGDLGKFLGYN